MKMAKNPNFPIKLPLCCGIPSRTDDSSKKRNFCIIPCAIRFSPCNCSHLPPIRLHVSKIYIEVASNGLNSPFLQFSMNCCLSAGAVGQCVSIHGQVCAKKKQCNFKVHTKFKKKSKSTTFIQLLKMSKMIYKLKLYEKLLTTNIFHLIKQPNKLHA